VHIPPPNLPPLPLQVAEFSLPDEGVQLGGVMVEDDFSRMSHHYFLLKDEEVKAAQIEQCKLVIKDHFAVIREAFSKFCALSVSKSANAMSSMDIREFTLFVREAKFFDDCGEEKLWVEKVGSILDVC
jgi:hypothetical protein